MKSKFISFLAIFLIFHFPANTAHGQQSITSADSLLIVAMSYIDQGETKEGQKALEAAIEINSNLLAAYSALGRLAIWEEDWSKAAKQFDKILKRDPDNLEAHYYRGICWRETGKFRRFVILSQLMSDWEKAEEHFKWVISKDALYQDVLYQFALLQGYQRKYSDAIKLCHDQIRLRPELIEPGLGLYRLYRHFIKHEKDQKIFAWLAKQPWEEAHYFIGEKFRLQDRFAEADSVLQQMLSKDLTMSRQPLFLSLVRIYFGKQDVERAEQYFWQAVENIQTPLDADLVFEDIKYIMTDQELEKYRSLASRVDKINFFRTFWAKRDPTPAARTNARLTEHYRRLLFAEKHYEYDGFRRRANSSGRLEDFRFPEAYKLNDEFFNDKGLVYLRHGPPDESIVTLGATGIDPNIKYDELPESNESWMYWKMGQTPELVFHFIYPNHVSGNLWMLTTLFHHPLTWEDRAVWDPTYYRLLHATHPGERFVLEKELAHKNWKSLEAGLASDRHSWDKKIKPLDLQFYTATFRDKNGQTDLEVYFGLPVYEIAKTLSDTASRIQLENGFAIHDDNWQPLDKQLRQTIIPFERKKINTTDLFLDLFRASVAPDSYYIAIHARPEKTDLLAEFSELKINIPDYSTPTLAISDILLASDIQPTNQNGKFVRNGLLIVPKLAKRWAIHKPIYIYFEIYNLALNDEKESSFSIDYTMSFAGEKRAAKKSLGLFGSKDKSSVSVRSDRNGHASFSYEYLALEVGNLEKGEYVLTVKVTDKQTGKTVEKIVPQLKIE